MTSVDPSEQEILKEGTGVELRGVTTPSDSEPDYEHSATLILGSLALVPERVTDEQPALIIPLDTLASTPAKKEPRSARVKAVDAGEDIVRQYLNELWQYPLLKKEEEAELAVQVRRGTAAQARLTQGGEISPEEVARLKRDVKRGMEAKDRFIEANLRLVVSIAKRYQGLGRELADLIQDGNLGVMRAVEKFDHEKGFKFSTYATWWIRQSITRELANHGRTIRIPNHMVDRMHKVDVTRKRLAKELQREPTVSELAAETRLKEEDVEDVLHLARVSESLDETLGEEGTTTRGDLVADPTTSSFADLLTDERNSKQIVAELLDELDPREREIFKLRFGLDGAQPLTLEETGRRFSLTRERIRQIQDRAESKIRGSSRGRSLGQEFYDFFG